MIYYLVVPDRVVCQDNLLPINMYIVIVPGKPPFNFVFFSMSSEMSSNEPEEFKYYKIAQYQCDFKPQLLEIHCKTINRFFKTCAKSGRSVEYQAKQCAENEVIVLKI